MEYNEIERRNDMDRREDRREMAMYDSGTSAAGLAWKLVGGTALAVAAVAFLFALPDIKRYIKISRM